VASGAVPSAAQRFPAAQHFPAEQRPPAAASRTPVHGPPVVRAAA